MPRYISFGHWIIDGDTAKLRAPYNIDLIDADFTTTGNISAALISASGYITAGSLMLASGSITDSSGTINFSNDNLITTGNITAGTTLQGGTIISVGNISAGGLVLGSNSNWDAAYTHSQIAGGNSVHVSTTENTNWDTAYNLAYSYLNQSVKNTASPTFKGTIYNFTNDDFLVTTRTNSSAYSTIGLQCQTTNQHTIFELYKKTATTTGVCGVQIFGYGTPTGANSIREMLSVYWDGTNYSLLSSNLGAGTTLRPILLSVQGNTNQLKLLTDGGIIMATLKSGATQAAAGAAVSELWKTNGHATLPDNVLMIGV
jgi:hypothetical protein